jgi:excisionase family DNA binding protein
MTGEIVQPMVQSMDLPCRRSQTVPEWPSWSIEEASEQTGYNREYLRRLIRRGQIEAVKVGPAYLIRVSSLQAYIENLDRTDGRTGAKP